MKTLRILVPLDGSKLSEAILPFVSSLPRAAVTLVRVAADRSAGSAVAPPRGEAGAAERDLAWVAERLRQQGLGDVRAPPGPRQRRREGHSSFGRPRSRAPRARAGAPRGGSRPAPGVRRCPLRRFGRLAPGD